MLTITVPAVDFWDEVNQEFIPTEETTIVLEHSLVSLSKWEAIWEKPFLKNEPKTSEETLSYIQTMSVGDDIPLDVCLRLSNANLLEINSYIESKMTATWFNDKAVTRTVQREVITAEVIYYWMGALQIPFECETWHLNRLITLIKVINQKNASNSDTKNKPLTKNDLASRRALNEARRAQYQTSG